MNQVSLLLLMFFLLATLIYDTITTPANDARTSCRCIDKDVEFMECRGPCDHFPGDYINHTHLSVIRTAIHTIYKGDLVNLEHLTSLKIDYNSYLSEIEPGVFSGMNILKELSISFNNKLSNLTNDIFKGLYNLTDLKLMQNDFLSIGEIAYTLHPKFLPRLVNLSLSENTFGSINAEDLSPMEGSKLREIQLRLCQLQSIHPDAFKPLKNLRHLKLCSNALSPATLANLMQQMIQDNITLESLNLGNMLFQGIPAELLSVIGKSGITTLNLESNNFSHLRRGSFPLMPRLRYLNLKSCSLMKIGHGTFDVSFLPSLRILSLANNYLTTISYESLPVQVTDLDISGNSFNERNPVNFILGEGNFVNMTNLTTLNISYVFLEVITRKTFHGLENLTDVLGLKNSSISSIEPGSFRELTRLTFLNLENNHFSSKTPLNAELFEGLESLEVLVLIGCGISNFSDVHVFSSLQKLEYLMLDDNDIVKLSPEVLFPLINLVGLSAERNNLEPWTDSSLFQYNPNISQVFLAHNKLMFLSYVMLEDFSKLQVLSLHHNIFICDCTALYHANMWARNGNNFSLESILYPPEILPYCKAPKQWDSRALHVFLKLSVKIGTCPTEYSNIFIWVGIPVSIFLLFGIVSGVLGCRYRSHIRYCAFLARRDLRRRGMSRYRGKRRVVSEGYTNYQYDAFVSYSNEDRNFVVRLVAMLENYEPFPKLCVYERDFEIGTMISEAVLESVAASRKTLLVVSDAFARSQWCMWELSLAEHHRLFLDDVADGKRIHRDDTLIIVKLGNIRSSNMTPTLKYLMRTRVYLEWDQDHNKQRIFWEKLRAALAPPTISIMPSSELSKGTNAVMTGSIN